MRPRGGAEPTVSEAIEDALEEDGNKVAISAEGTITAKNLRSVAESGRSFSVSVQGGSWHFDSITHTNMEFNPIMHVGSNADAPEVRQKMRASGVNNATVVSFEHSGSLPGVAHVGIGVSYEVGTRLYFYYYNPSSGSFEYQGNTVVEPGKYAVVTLSHCSDYVLTPTPLGPIPNEAATTMGSNPAAGTNASTGTNTSTGTSSAAPGRVLDSTPHTGK